MAWVEEFAGWLWEKFVYDDVGRELDRLSNLLRNPDAEERLSAVRHLSFMNAPDSIALLIGALGDVAAPVRRAAARGLGHKAAGDAIAPIAILLDDPDPEVRREAVQALDAIGNPVAHSWLRFWRERVIAATSDGRIAELLGRALSDSDSVVRTEALMALPRHGARGVAIVRDHLTGATNAAELDAVRQRLAGALQARDADHRKAAVETLFSLFGTDSIRDIAGALDDSDPSVRKAAIEAVSSLGPRAALDELLPRLEDPDEGVVVRVIEGLVCARSLEELSDAEEERIHQELLRLVRYGSGWPREVAVWAVGELRRVESISTLCDLLEGEDSGSLLSVVCEALGKIGDPRSITPMLALLERGTGEKATMAAIGALARTNDVRVIRPFVWLAFGESRPEVDRAYDAALRMLCGAAEERMHAELQSADQDVRLAAIRRAVTDPRTVFVLMAQVLEGDPEIRTGALDVLQKQGFDLLEMARRALRAADKDEPRRILAISLISALAPPDAAQLFASLLLDPSEPPGVYRHAVAALQRMGSLEILKQHSAHANEVVREAVQQALAPPPSAGS